MSGKKLHPKHRGQEAEEARKMEEFRLQQIAEKAARKAVAEAMKKKKKKK